MFRIKAGSLAAHRSHLESTRAALPQAHRLASGIASTATLDALRAAADEAGWDPEDSLGLAWDGAQHHITVAHSEAGDRVFDQEYGGPDSAPNPVLRTTISGFQDRANDIYTHHLVSKLGVG